MPSMRKFHYTAAAGAMLLALLCMTPEAHAGRTCEEDKPSLQSIERGLTLAERTQAALDASGQRVVILARAGQDLTKYSLQYSHLGFAYRQPDGKGGSVWRVLHKLNTCGAAESAVYRQGRGEFFLDAPWRYEAAWVVPSQEVQDKLLPLLQDNSRAAALHTRPYSIVSYAWGRKYQQSNQWALETLAMAMEPSANSREGAQAWLQFKGYQPTTLKIGALSRLGGRVTAANVAFDDHPNEKRFSDRIETVTVDSIFSFLQRSALAGPAVVVKL
jgi:hypothetical protein